MFDEQEPPDETASLIATTLAGARPSSNGWLRANCPMCPTRAGKRDTKASFAYHTGSGGFYCLRCGWRGRSAGAAVFIGQDLRSRLAVVADQDSEVGKPPGGFVLLDQEPARSSIFCEPARSFLDRRGVGPAQRHRARIGICLDRSHRVYGRIIIPILEGGRWLGWIARSSLKHHPVPYLYSRGMNRAEILYNAPAVQRQTSEPLLVVEGAFDQIWLGDDAVAVLGKPSYQQLQMFLAAPRPVCFFLDGDAWREAFMFVERLRVASGQFGKFALVRAAGGLDPDEYPPEAVRAAAHQVLNEQSGFTTDPLACFDL